MAGLRYFCILYSAFCWQFTDLGAGTIGRFDRLLSSRAHLWLCLKNCSRVHSSRLFYLFSQLDQGPWKRGMPLFPDYASNSDRAKPLILSETVTPDGVICTLFIHQLYPKLFSWTKGKGQNVGFLPVQAKTPLCIQQRKMIIHGTLQVPSLSPAVFNLSFFHSDLLSLF